MIQKVRSYLLFIVLILISCKSQKPDSRALIEKNQIQIIVDYNAPASVKLASRELLRAFQKIGTDKVIISNEYNESYRQTFYLGQSDYLKALKLDLPSHERDEFSIRSIDRGLILVGNDSVFNPKGPHSVKRSEVSKANEEWTKIVKEDWLNPLSQIYKAYNPKLDLWEYDSKGTLNAVYYYLESLGFRWFLPGELGEVVPQIDTVPLTKFNINKKTAFPLRNLYFGGRRFYQATEEDILWYLRLGLSSGPDVIGHSSPGHGLNNVIKNQNQYHRYPEMYAMFNNRRTFKQKEKVIPCLTSQKLIDQCIDYTRSVFDLYNEPSISLMPPDGFIFACEHETCQKKYTPKRGEEGKYSDYVWNFINTVAKEVYKTHPTKKISCFAYTTYLLPPEGIDEFSPNVLVGIARKRRDLFNQAEKKRYVELHEKWLDKIPSKKLLHWDYYLDAEPSSPNVGFPVVFSNIISEDIGNLKEDLLGEFIEVYRILPPDNESILDLAFNHYNVYITAKTYQNPDLEIEKLKNDYFQKFYGSAGSYIKELFLFSEKSWHELSNNEKGIEKLDRQIDLALSQNITNVERKRILLLEQYLSPLRRIKKLNELRSSRIRNVRQARALNKSKSKFILDGSLKDELWTGIHAYPLKAVKKTKKKYKNTVMFAHNKTHLLLAGEFENFNKTLNDAFIFKVKTLDDTTITIKADKRGDLHIEGLSSEKGVRRKISHKNNSWTLEMEIPYSVSASKGKKFPENEIYRPNKSFPLVFNVLREIDFTDGSRRLFAYHYESSDDRPYADQYSELIFR